MQTQQRKENMDKEFEPIVTPTEKARARRKSMLDDYLNSGAKNLRERWAQLHNAAQGDFMTYRGYCMVLRRAKRDMEESKRWTKKATKKQ